MKNYYDCFDRRFHSIVTMLVLKINCLQCEIGRGACHTIKNSALHQAIAIDWNVATRPLPLSPTHTPSPQRGVLRREVQTSSGADRNNKMDVILLSITL